MESILSYTIIIVFIVISVYVYNIRKNTTRTFLLSDQHYPIASLNVWIQKEKGKIESIIIEVKNTEKLRIVNIKTELITGKREFNYYDHRQLSNSYPMPVELPPDKDYKMELPFNSFKELMSEGEHPFRTFRFVVECDGSKTFKSHELGFNSKWVIYRPDTGSYN